MAVLLHNFYLTIPRKQELPTSDCVSCPDFDRHWWSRVFDSVWCWWSAGLGSVVEVSWWELLQKFHVCPDRRCDSLEVARMHLQHTWQQPMFCLSDRLPIDWQVSRQTKRHLQGRQTLKSNLSKRIKAPGNWSRSFCRMCQRGLFGRWHRSDDVHAKQSRNACDNKSQKGSLDSKDEDKKKTKRK